jgi:hypothetical protein
MSVICSRTAHAHGAWYMVAHGAWWWWLIISTATPYALQTAVLLEIKAPLGRKAL